MARSRGGRKSSILFSGAVGEVASSRCSVSSRQASMHACMHAKQGRVVMAENKRLRMNEQTRSKSNLSAPWRDGGQTLVLPCRLCREGRESGC